MQRSVEQSRPIDAPSADVALLDQLSGLVEQVAGLRLDPDVGFFEAGLTSVVIVQFHAAIQVGTGCDFPVTDLFRFPTLRSLACHIASGGVQALRAPQVPVVNAAGRGGDARQAAQARREIRRKINQGRVSTP